ncbi:MAG: carboxypeptidase-like regulatory domain-containing protein [Bacteroidales bacterium]|nr:carboxypeptidase-like regulatory domain-containing protein [Bacteroidales bacterium]
MKKLLSVLLCLAFAGLTSCTHTEYDLFGNISGTVIDVDTGEPVQQATVTLSPTSKNTYTGLDGQFEFHELESQQYTVTVQKTGYQANRKLVNVNPSETTNVALVMKKQ